MHNTLIILAYLSSIIKLTCIYVKKLVIKFEYNTILGYLYMGEKIVDEIYDFGKILQSLRKKYGMTQEQLAAKINRESSIISRYEKNLQSPTFETVRAFASIFNVSMDYLSGMNNRRQISTFGLQETQIELLLKLSDFFREKNSNLKQETDNSYALIGEIVSKII